MRVEQKVVREAFLFCSRQLEVAEMGVRAGAKNENKHFSSGFSVKVCDIFVEREEGS